MENQILRAIIEIDGPSVRIFPVSQSESDAAEILDACKEFFGEPKTSHDPQPISCPNCQAIVDGIPLTASTLALDCSNCGYTELDR
jgi:hypothetical protein